MLLKLKDLFVHVNGEHSSSTAGAWRLNPPQCCLRTFFLPAYTISLYSRQECSGHVTTSMKHLCQNLTCVPTGCIKCIYIIAYVYGELFGKFFKVLTILIGNRTTWTNDQSVWLYLSSAEIRPRVFFHCRNKLKPSLIRLHSPTKLTEWAKKELIVRYKFHSTLFPLVV